METRWGRRLTCIQHVPEDWPNSTNFARIVGINAHGAPRGDKVGKEMEMRPGWAAVLAKLDANFAEIVGRDAQGSRSTSAEVRAAAVGLPGALTQEVMAELEPALLDSVWAAMCGGMRDDAAAVKVAACKTAGAWLCLPYPVRRYRGT